MISLDERIATGPASETPKGYNGIFFSNTKGYVPSLEELDEDVDKALSLGTKAKVYMAGEEKARLVASALYGRMMGISGNEALKILESKISLEKKSKGVLLDYLGKGYTTIRFYKKTDEFLLSQQLLDR
jgi:hypothetical protein